MKKILLGIVGIIFLTILTIAMSFFSHVNDAYEIKESGYTYNLNGKAIVFSKDAKYSNEWLDNQKIIIDHSKKKPIDLSRALFLKNENIHLLGKSVVIKSGEELIELPKNVDLKGENETEKVTDEKDKQIAQLPKGTVIKLAEGRYLILDDAHLKNDDGLTKQLVPQTIVSIDENKKIRLMSEQKTEELAGDDLYITMDNNPYKFYLKEELFVSTNENQLNIDVRSIKIDMDDLAEARDLHDKDSTNISSSDSSSSSTSNDDNKNNGSNAQKENNGSDIEVENTVDENENSKENGSSNGKNGNEDNSNKDGKNESGESGSKGGTNKDSDDSSNGNKSGNKENVDEVNDIIDKINQAQNLNDFHVPIVDVTLTVQGKTVSGDVKIIDTSNKLSKLEVVLYDKTTDTIIETKDLANTKKEDTFVFTDLEYGDSYQIVVQGSYISTNGKEQATTFYRNTFKATPAQFDKEVVEYGEDYLILSITPKELFGTVEKLELSYKKNDVNEKLKDKVEVLSEGMEEGKSVEVRIDGLDSNTEYLIEMNELIIDEKDVTDDRWYLLATTTKKNAKIKGLELAYKDYKGGFTVSPIALEDPDDTITSIRYNAYLLDDYFSNGEEAKVWATAVVGSDQKNSIAKVARTVDMPGGKYIFIAYIYGKQTQGDYTVKSPPSNSVEIGTNIEPEVRFSLKEEFADELQIDYEIYDSSSVLRYDVFTHPEIRLYASNANGEVGEEEKPVYVIPLYEDPENFDTLIFKELKQSTWYVAQLYASYDLDDGAGVQKDVLIKDQNYQAFKTLEVEPVESYFIQNKEETTEKKVVFNVNLSPGDRAKRIKTAKINIYDEADALTDTIALEESDIEKMVREQGAQFSFEKLDSNKFYSIKIENAIDGGANEIYVSGDLGFKTRKVKPTADSIFLNYVNAESTVNLKGLIGYKKNGEETPLFDKDEATKSIEYNLEKKVKNFSIVDTTKISVQFDKEIDFNILKETSGLGFVYKISAILNWNDNYEDKKIELTSSEKNIEKRIGKVEYQIVSKDESNLKLKVSVNDPDKTIIEKSLVLKTSGFSQNLNSVKNEVTVPISTLGDFNLITEGKTQVLYQGPIVSGKMIEKKFKEFKLKEMSTMTADLSVDVPNKSLVLETKSSSSQENMIAVQNELFSKKEKITSWSTNGDGLFGNSRVSIPINKKIWFDNSYNLSVTSNIQVEENQMKYGNISGNFYMNTNTGYVTNSGISINRNNAVVVELTTGTTDENGNINDVEFKNILNNKYLGLNKTSLDFSSDRPLNVNLIRQPDGSYIVEISGRYAQFGIGNTTTDPKYATAIDLYSVGVNTIPNVFNSNLNLSALTKPEIKIDKVQALDTYINFKSTGKNPNDVIVRADGKLQVYANIYKKDGTTLVKSIRSDYASINKMWIDGLDPNTDYVIKIEGIYDLLDSKGEIKTIFDKVAFKTEETIPVIEKTDYVWNPSKQLIEGRIQFEDISKLLSNISYVLYEWDSELESIDFEHTGKSEIEQILSTKKKVASYEYLNPDPNNLKDSNIELSMFKDGKQQYLAKEDGKKYVIAAYMTAEIKGESEVFLGNASKISIVSPKIDKINLTLKDKGTKWVQYNFDYTDTDGYIVGGNNKKFTYKIIELATDKIVYQGSFTGSVSGFWPYSNSNEVLKPGLAYKFVIEYESDLLDGNGPKTNKIENIFNTESTFLSHTRLIMDYSNEKINLTLNQLGTNEATITEIKAVLYEIINRGLEDEKYVEIGSPQIIQLPTENPANLENIIFDSSGLEGKYVISKMFISYNTPYDTREEIIVSSELRIPEKLSKGVKVDFSSVNVVGNRIEVEVDAEHIEPDDQYTLSLTDDSGNIIEKKSQLGSDFSHVSSFNLGSTAAYNLTLSDKNDEIVAQQVGNNEANLISVNIEKDKLFFTSQFSKNNEEEVLIKISPKKLSLWKTIQTWFGRDFSKEYSVTKGELREGYVIERNNSDDIVEVQEKKSNEPIGIIETEASK